MTALIIFPTIRNIYNAGRLCHLKNLEISETFITARENTAKTIDRIISSGKHANILLLSPARIDNPPSNVICPQDSEIGSLDNPDTEKYLKYKKTLMFLGDVRGSLATEHLTEAVNHLAKGWLKAPEEDKAVVTAFAEMDFPALEGRSPRMTELKQDIQRIAKSGLHNLLLLGETGTGKEAVSFFLHALDPIRKSKRFGSVNCATLQEEFLISELFGHEKGAFTGAYQKKAGLISELNGGTLFLDEIAEIPPKVQAMLLRFLESGEYTPLGSNHAKRVDLKIIAAGQSSLLHEKIRKKVFRQDLYFRLAGKTISLPTLSEIPEDIPTLVVHLAYKTAPDDSENRDRAITYFYNRMDELQAHSWPGNVRELANYVNRRIKLGDDESINLNEFASIYQQENAPLPERVRLQTLTTQHITAIQHPDQIEPLEEIKRRYVQTANALLREKGYTQAQICKKLGLAANTLKKMI